MSKRVTAEPLSHAKKDSLPYVYGRSTYQARDAVLIAYQTAIENGEIEHEPQT